MSTVTKAMNNDGGEHVTSNTPTEEDVMEVYDHNKIMLNMVQFQVEYYFSDANLAMDNHLLSKMHENGAPHYWVPIAVVCSLSKIKETTDEETIVVDAIRRSKQLILSEDAKFVRRPDYVPPKPRHHKNLRHTVLLYGLAPGATKEEVIEMCSEYGAVKSVAFDVCCGTGAAAAGGGATTVVVGNDGSTVTSLESDPRRPDREIAIQIMTKKFGPRAVRCNSVQYDHVMSVSDQKEFLAMEQRRVSDEGALSNARNSDASSTNNRKSCSGGGSGDDDKESAKKKETMTKKSNGGGDGLRISVENIEATSSTKMTSPVFAHPVAHPSGDPLNFRHLRTCFVVFESQSQANKCVRGRARSNDGIRAMYMYDYIKFKKRMTLVNAVGVKPLLSPETIGLTLNSPSFAMLGSPAMRSSITAVNVVNVNANANTNGNNDGGMQNAALNYYLGDVPIHAIADPPHIVPYSMGSPMLFPHTATVQSLSHDFHKQLGVGQQQQQQYLRRPKSVPHAQSRGGGGGRGRNKQKYQPRYRNNCNSKQQQQQPQPPSPSLKRNSYDSLSNKKQSYVGAASTAKHNYSRKTWHQGYTGRQRSGNNKYFNFEIVAPPSADNPFINSPQSVQSLNVSSNSRGRQARGRGGGAGGGAVAVAAHNPFLMGASAQTVPNHDVMLRNSWNAGFLAAQKMQPNNGRVPPSPSPNYFQQAVNGTVMVSSYAPPFSLSPMHYYSPTVAPVSQPPFSPQPQPQPQWKPVGQRDIIPRITPPNGRGIMNRASR